MAIALGSNQINKAYLGTTEVQKMYLGADLVFDNSTQPSELTPVMSNFRIEDANKDRVYFDVVGDISGMTTTGFVVSGKTITAVDSTLNYFTVDTPFTFWDNNTIRLGENTDTFNEIQANTMLDNFTLSYINNNITEPTATVSRYVSSSGSGDGTSEGNAASLSYMATNAVAGQTWWVKAGNYSNQTVSLTADASTDSPIKIIGYKSTIGDITDNYIGSYTDILNNWSTSEMPTITGNTTGTAFVLGADYIIIRNFQVDSVQKTATASNGASNILIERFNHKDNSSSTVHTGFSLLSSNMERLRFKDCVSLNMKMGAIVIQGFGDGFNLYENVKSYSSGMDEDYYLTLSGSNNIIRNCNVSAPSELSSNHGIGVKAGENVALQDNDYNLIERCHSIGIAESYYWRGNRTYNNVIKDCYATGISGGSASGGLYFWGGSRYNIVERNLFENLENRFIMLQDNDEDPSHDEVGAYNIVRNNVFDGAARRAMYGSSDAVESLFNDNKFYNNTFMNSPDLYEASVGTWGGVVIQNLNWTNNIFINIGNPTSAITGMLFNNNDFHNCGTWANTFIDSDGNVGIDPQLDANYLPANENLKVATLPNVLYDYNSKERNATETTIGGVTLTSESAGEQPPVTDIDYYVSFTDGLDTNDGLTEQTAWKTLAKVEAEKALFTASKVIGFKGGDTWNETITLTDLIGTLGNEITFTSYGTGQASMSGTKPISGFTVHSGNVYVADVDPADKAYQVFKDGALQHNGSIPIVTNIYETFDNFYTFDSGSGTTWISSDLIGKPDLVGAKIHYTTNTWTLNIAEIVAFNSTTGEVVLDQSISSGGDNLFFLNNNINLLASDGDWYYDDANDKLYLYSDTSPTGIEITSAESTGVLFYQCDYVNVDNIEVYGYGKIGVHISLCENVKVDNSNVRDQLNNNIQAESNSNYITSNNNIVSGSNGFGISVKGTNCVVTGNEVFNMGLLHGRSWTDFANTSSAGVGIESYSDLSTIQRNTVYDVGGSGIRFMKGNNNIKNNFIKNFALNVHDVGGVYNHATLITDDLAEGSVLDYNIIEGNKEAQESWKDYCYYMDGTGDDVTITNNTSTYGYNGIKFRSRINSVVTDNKIYSARDDGFDYTHTVGTMEKPENNTVERNDILTINTQRCSIKIWNSVNGLYDYGVLNNNKYMNLASDRVVELNTTTDKGDYTLPGWITKSGFDVNTMYASSFIEQYPVSSTIAQLITNSTFDVDTSGWSGYQNSFSLGDDGGDNFLIATLTGSSGTVKSNTFSVVEGTEYLIKYKVKKDIVGDYDLQFSVKNTENNQFDFYIAPNTDWRVYEFKFTATATADVWLEWFYSTADSNQLHLDDVYFDEVVFDETERTSIMYNNTLAADDIPVPVGTWYNVEGVLQSGTVNLQPFESIMLVNYDIGLLGDGNSLGPELLTNGEFDTNTDWTLMSGWVIAGGTCDYSGVGSSGSNFQETTMEIGKTYRIEAILPVGSVRVRNGSGSAYTEITSGVPLDMVCAGNEFFYFADLGNATAISIDSFSLKEVL